MTLLTRSLSRDFAVLWPQNSSVPDDYGQPQRLPPVEVHCYWADEVREFFDKDGVRQLSNAVVYVDRDVQIGDMLTHCRLAALISTDPINIRANPDSWEVRQFKKSPNKRRSEFLRECFL